MATTLTRAEEATERCDVMQPLLSPWFKLDEPRSTETPRRRGFWGSLGQFLFDYNRF